MSKNRQICFYTSDRNKKFLEDIANEKGVALDIFLENIVVEYLSKIGPAKSFDEKRAFPRREANLPVVVQMNLNKNETHYRTGVIKDMSVNGIKISLPKYTRISTELGSVIQNFEILFKIPDTSEPIVFECEAVRVNKQNDHIEVGAEFTNSDFYCMQAFHKFMM